MGKVIIFILSFAIAMIMMIYNTEVSVSTQVLKKINASIKHATHDAALFLDKTHLAEGLVVFDQTKGLETFRSTLAKNLGLKPDSLQPNESNFLIQDEIEILDMQFIDDLAQPNCEKLGIEPFPCVYQYNSQGIIKQRLILGPSTVFVIRTNVFAYEEPLIFASVYQYRD